eukprot:GILI01002857.1.p1 GENE.GILI01002857.1~~GILI01002857.1.p1  ORF type:complete len:561 (+),score=74.53 GILI01002857.1:70-1683(+)
MACNISTRGNADSIVCALVLATLYFLFKKRVVLSALCFGMSVHFKIYPIIYAIPIVFLLDESFYSSSSSSSSSPPAAPMKVQFDLAYLPPILLHATRPSDYPSVNPPKFDLLCSWLTSSQISILRESLDTMWAPGSVVLFSWVHFLQNDALSTLGCADKLLLSEEAMKEIQSHPYFALMKTPSLRRSSSALSASKSSSSFSSSIIETLLNYDKARRKEIFDSTIQTCGICLEPKAGTSCHVLFGCNHHFCRPCLTQYLQVNIESGSVNQLLCPEPKCKHAIIPPEIRELVTPEHFTRYDELLLARSLDSMSDVVWCPRTECQYPVIVEGRMGICSTCCLTFCVKCRKPWHFGRRCGIGSSGNVQDDSVKEQMQTLEYICQTTKRCPGCKTGISRTEGCNHMICTNCNVHFCYSCLKPIKGYDHFNAPGATCTTFSEDRMGADDDDDNDLVSDLRKMALANIKKWLADCPKCNRSNPKLHRTNVLTCSHCKTQYCWLCEEECPDDNHFSTGACIKNTEVPDLFATVGKYVSKSALDSL